MKKAEEDGRFRNIKLDEDTSPLIMCPLRTISSMKEDVGYDVLKDLYPFSIMVDKRNKSPNVLIFGDKRSIIIRDFLYQGFDVPYQAFTLIALFKNGLTSANANEDVEKRKELIKMFCFVDKMMVLFMKKNDPSITVTKYFGMLGNFYKEIYLEKDDAMALYEYWMKTIETRKKECNIWFKEKFPEEADKEENKEECENTSPETNNKTKWWHTALLAGIFLGLLSLAAYIIF